MSSSQVCRPHFHAPLHPWLSSDGAKPLAHHSSPWVPFGGSDPDKSQSPSSGGPGGGQPHNLFSFPPTPPKDSTPDSVLPSGGAGAEYQSAVAAAMGAFMHDTQQSCAHDVKPSAGGIGAGSGNKQREGSEYEGGSSGMFNGNFDSSYGSPYGHGIHGAAASAYSPQGKHHQALAAPGQGQGGNKPRNKSRTSAGKTRCLK